MTSPRNGMSIDLSVGEVTIILSSLSTRGFSFHPIEEEGLELDFENFTGTLRVMPLMTNKNAAKSDSSSTSSQEEVTLQENGEPENESKHENNDDLCHRLMQACSAPVHQQEQQERIPTNQQDSSTANTPSESQHFNPQNELHVACARPNVCISELSTLLSSQSDYASQQDEQGRYPLHVLSENASLLTTWIDYPRQVQSFVIALLKAYPEALFGKDKNGNVPFTVLLKRWIQDSYQETSTSTTTDDGIVRTLQRQATKMTRVLEPSSHAEEEEHNVVPDTNTLFPRVTMSPAVITAFSILSTYLSLVTNHDDYDDSSSSLESSQLMVRAALAQQIASIPYLLKTLYLVDSNNARNEVLHTLMVQRILYCVESIQDNWVNTMLRHGDIPSQRAVDYLQDVSRVTVEEYCGVSSPSQQAVEAFEANQTQLYKALNTVISSLSVLSNKEQARAATTNVVWTSMNDCICRPIVIGIQSADFVFNVLLLLTFRYYTENNNIYVPGTDTALSQQDGNMLVVSLCFYFLIRKLSEFYSMWRISTRAFCLANIDFWNLVDVVAIIMATVAVTSRITNVTFLAITMAMLWLKFLSYLTAVNMHLATFIMAVVEIVKDIRWFLLVLALTLLMFGDVIQIITRQSVDQDYCAQGDAPAEFCTDEVAPIFLKLFAVLVGDMELTEFKYSSAIQVLFLIFALLGVIILLNVLIAVVSDSYQKAVEHSTELFGRARLKFVVKVVAQENFLFGDKFPLLVGCGLTCLVEHSMWIIVFLGRLLNLAALVSAAIISEYCLVLLAMSTYKNSGWWVFCAIFAGFILFSSILLVFQDLFERRIRMCASRRGCSWLTKYLDATARAAKKCNTVFFGAGGLDEGSEDVKGDPRVQMIESSMVQIASSTRDAIVESLEAVECRVKNHLSAVGESIRVRMNALAADDTDRKEMF